MCPGDLYLSQVISRRLSTESYLLTDLQIISISFVAAQSILLFFHSLFLFDSPHTYRTEMAKLPQFL